MEWNWKGLVKDKRQKRKWLSSLTNITTDIKLEDLYGDIAMTNLYCKTENSDFFFFVFLSVVTKIEHSAKNIVPIRSISMEVIKASVFLKLLGSSSEIHYFKQFRCTKILVWFSSRLCNLPFHLLLFILSFSTIL